jgi:iron(II)-dependent oxidoreductase
MTHGVAQIAERLERVRERTFDLYAPLSKTDMTRTPDPIMSPPVWDLGHIAAYEELWVACRVGGADSLHPELQAAYDAFETPRAVRTSIRLLDEAGCRDYLARVRERTLALLEDTDLEDEGSAFTHQGFVFDLVAEHEAQHTETVLQALQMYGDGTYRPHGRRPLPGATAVDDERIVIPGGTFAMGAPAAGFAYDCERPRHDRTLAGFVIDRYPVTNRRHLEFMADGGYSRPELWSAEGWEWRCAEAAEAPLYWEPDGAGGWTVRSFDAVDAADPDRPVSHVSFHEAQAHARWAGGRLPSEAEWERAACAEPSGCGGATYPWGATDPGDRANLDQLGFGTAPVGAYPAGESPTGCAQLIGDVWEWTATAFDGYPGFRAFPYREYAEVFFGRDYRVLRGGSWATQPIAARTTFRNWDLPQRRQIFSGFRLAWDL